MSESKTIATSKSQLQDLNAERKGVFLTTFGVFVAAAVYILCMLIALPFAVHLTVNVANDNCVGACFSPTTESQAVLNNVLLTLRGGTFLFGNFLGLLGDRYGRRPVMIFALAGYAIAGAFYFTAWTTKTLALFFVGAAILGIASPLNPHGIAYVSDISLPHRAATNMGVLQGLGYFVGLMTGAGLSLVIGNFTTQSNVAVLPFEEQLEAGSDQQVVSYLTGLGLGVIGVLVFVFFLPESLHKEERAEFDIKKANPLGIFFVLYGNGYRICVWLASMCLWASVGAGESVTGGWWLRRYAISDPTQFFLYLVAVWILAGIGSVVMTKIYMKKGLKFAVHLTSILTIVTGIFTAEAPNVAVSYVAGASTFFSSAAMPVYLALFMGQASPTQKGEYSGVYRTSEALAKFIGIQVVGGHFADTIKPFTPDESCVDDDSCLCGVESCPDISKGGKFVPKVCTLGPYLSSNFVPIDYTDEDSVDNCVTPGAQKSGPMNVTTNKLWCVPHDTEPFVSQGLGDLGCYKNFNSPGFGACLGSTDQAKFEFFTTANLTCEINGEDTFIFGDAATKFEFLTETFPFLVPTGNNSDVIRAQNEEHCPQRGKATIPVCWKQPHGNFPGYIMYFIAGLVLLGWIFFCIGEFFFVEGDARYWTAEDEDEIALGVIEPEEAQKEESAEEGNDVAAAAESEDKDVEAQE